MIGELQGEQQLHDLFDGVGNCMLLLLYFGGPQRVVEVEFGLKRRDVK